MQRAFLAISQRSLGPEGSLTLKSMNNLAGALSDLGRSEESEAMHRQALSLYQKSLGKEDADTLYCMNDLALVCEKTGKCRAIF